MKTFSKLTIGLGLLLGSGVGAMANVAWTQNDAEDFTVPQTVGGFFPSPIATVNKGATKFTDPYLISEPSNTGEKTGLSNSVFPVTSDHIVSVADIVATPEPSGLPLLGAGAILVGLLVRRKLVRVS